MKKKKKKKKNLPWFLLINLLVLNQSLFWGRHNWCYQSKSWILVNLFMVLLCECCVSLKLESRFRGVTLSHTLCVFLPSYLEHGCVTNSQDCCVYKYV